MKDYKNWIIGVLMVTILVMSWLALSCSRLDAQDKLYKECNSFTMYEDGSYTCERQDNSRYTGCVKGAKCED